jgi:hypothetical protein
MTDDQRISNIIELAHPLDREALGELAGWIAIELGAMKAADEYRDAVTAAQYIPPSVVVQAIRQERECWEPVITELPDWNS